MEKKYSLGISLNLLGAQAILLEENEGTIVTKITKNIADTKPNETISILLGLLEEIISKTNKYKNNIVGAGLALGGIVNDKKGVIYWPKKHGAPYYVSVPLKDYLEKKFSLPIILENDANACAWAEYKTNFSKYKNLLYLFSGVGCGIIIDGKLYRGKDGGAGELFLNPKETMASRLGDFSFLKPWPADLDIVKRAKELISLGRDTSLIKKVTSTGELFLKDVFEEAKKKDKVCCEVLKEAAFSLGVEIAYLVNLLNPEAIVIGGGLETAGEFFLEECLNAVKSFSFSEMRKNLKITFSALSNEAASLGAALIVFKENTLQS